MKKNRYFWALASIVLACSIASLSAAESARQVFSFNQGWEFYRPAPGDAGKMASLDALPDDKQWEQVNLPHTVRLEPLNASGGRNYQGVCWYRRHFTVPAEWNGKKLLLRFGGAMQVADIWLNDQKLTTHYGGYLPFTVDVTSAKKNSADNVLTVRLDNSDNPEVPPGPVQKRIDFTYFGGLYREVYLDVLNPVHVSDVMFANKPGGGGILVSYPKVTDKSATVCVQTDVINESSAVVTADIVHELCDSSGTVVATGRGTVQLAPDTSSPKVLLLEVTQPKLWHPYHPTLYVLETKIYDGETLCDQINTRVGIRTIKMDSHGLFINGEKFLSIGANRHQDHPYVGYALGGANHWRDMKKLRELGFTSIRSHYPQDPAFVDACDEMGVLLIVSNPGWQFWGNKLFEERVVQDAREMVRRDRNHACVILWEAALNETTNANYKLYPEINRMVHEEYPFDPCYTTGDSIAGKTGGLDWDVVYGKKPSAGGKEHRPVWYREWGDSVDNWSDQQSPVRIRRGWGETAQIIQAFSHLRSLGEDCSRFLTSSGNLQDISLCGIDLWAGIDAYRGCHYQPFYGGSLDLFRLPKFDAWSLASQRPPDVHIAGLEDGPMVFIANYASFQSPTTVLVFSNCEQVRLSQNGKVVGTASPQKGMLVPHSPFAFKINQVSEEQSTLYMTGVAKPGTKIGQLTAEGLIGGKVVATHTVTAPGVPRKLELQADFCGRQPVADGAEWVRIYCRVVDSRGTTCPYADERIQFSVEGEGQIINDERIAANPVQAEAGIATVLVRMSTKPGPVVVRAEAFGLTSGECTINSQPMNLPVVPGARSAAK